MKVYDVVHHNYQGAFALVIGRQAFIKGTNSDDVTFEIFKKLVKSGSKVRCIVTKNTKDKPRSFFDNIDKWAKEQGASGLAYFTIEKEENISAKGPVGKFFSKEALEEIMKITGAEIGDSIFFACGKINDVEKITSLAKR